MDAQAPTLLVPYLQYGAFGLCLFMLYLFWKAMQYWAKRDEDRQNEDKAREARMAAVIEEHQQHARQQAQQIAEIAISSVKAIEKGNETNTEITRVLRQIEVRMGSGFYNKTGG